MCYNFMSSATRADREAQMRIYDWNKMGRAEREALLGRCMKDIGEMEPNIRAIINDVREHGDAALVKYTKEFDRAIVKPSGLKATKKDFDAAEKRLPAKIKKAISKSAANVRKYHEKQMPEPMWLTEVEEGVYAGEKITPVVSAGLYVPRGKGSFPSVMIMLGIPAVVAGVKRLVVVTPPGPDGSFDDATLVAARECGIGDVYRVGGAQAVAALAYGTKSVPKVDKIIGPGSGYVTAAKRLLYGQVDVGLPAGPSESIILADEKADPEIVARDLLIEAEHGPDSAALLVTHSAALMKKVAAIVPGLVDALPEPRKSFCRTGLSGYGGAVLTNSLEQSIEFVNTFAPEHLEVLTQQPFEALMKIDNAGEILLGEHTPITLGNFCLGVDAILPTGGFARSFSGVTVYDFLKRSSIGYATKQGFDALAVTAKTLADYEGFPAHARAVEKRMAAKKDIKAKG